MANPKFPRMFSTNHSNAGGDPFCFRAFNYRCFSVLRLELAEHQALFPTPRSVVLRSAWADPDLGGQGAP